MKYGLLHISLLSIKQEVDIECRHHEGCFQEGAIPPLCYTMMNHQIQLFVLNEFRQKKLSYYLTNQVLNEILNHYILYGYFCFTQTNDFPKTKFLDFASDSNSRL